MYLFYLDESGTPADPHQNHLVVAGVCSFERQTYWLSSELDKIASRFNPADPASIELHGSPMFQGKKVWRSIPIQDRITAIKDALGILASSHYSNRIFACVVNKQKASPKDAVLLAFEQISSRFDYYLMRLHNQSDSQRGIMIFDKSTYETTIQGLAADFRTIGHSWGVLRNLAEVPLFLDSMTSRMIQLADLIAYSFFRYYESGDNQFYDIIKNRIDSEGGVTHGLYELV